MKKKLLGLFLIAFVFRLFLVPVAYHGDLNNNISWGDALLEYGTAGYYEQKSWEYSAPNQPPLYIFLFGLTSFIYQSIDKLSWALNNSLKIFPSSFIWWWERWGMIYLVKLPGIFADLGIAWVIYNFFKKRSKENIGFKLSLLWLVNPIVWYNSGIWGQTDSIVNLLGLVSIVSLLNHKLITSLIFITISILFKGSLTLFLPLIIFIGLLQKYNLQTWLRGVLFSGIITVLATLWFHPNTDLPIWLYNLYTQRFFPGEIGYLTANAFNLWYLVDPGKVLDSTVYFGLPARAWGLIAIGLAYALIFVRLLKSKLSDKNTLYVFSAFTLVTFLFMTRIHERYLYPFFPLATILIGFESMFLIPYLIFSGVFLLNMYNLFWAPGIAFLENFMLTSQLSLVLSLINLVVFASYLYLAKRIKTNI